MIRKAADELHAWKKRSFCEAQLPVWVCIRQPANPEFLASLLVMEEDWGGEELFEMFLGRLQRQDVPKSNQFLHSWLEQAFMEEAEPEVQGFLTEEVDLGRPCGNGEIWIRSEEIVETDVIKQDFSALLESNIGFVPCYRRQEILLAV